MEEDPEPWQWARCSGSGRAAKQPSQKGSPYFLQPNSLAKGKTGVQTNAHACFVAKPPS